ncbi:MAG: hypothetical protein IJY69_01070 [Clostridia bacterium]|nr:hypothetical protein [Clostridia bacterium]
MILRLGAVTLIAVIVSFLLGEMGYSGKRAVAALSMLLLFCAVTEGIADTVGQLLSLAEEGGVGEIAVTSVKVLGVGYVFGIVSEICEELGERGIASVAVNVGRIEIFLLVFPYFQDIVKMGIELIK